MNLFAPFPFVRLTFFLISGILISFVLNHPLIPLWVLAVFIVLYLALIAGNFSSRFMMPLVAYTFLVLAGIRLTMIHTAGTSSTHLARFEQSVEAVSGVITEPVIARPGSYQFTLSLRQIYTGEKWIPATANIKVFHDRSVKPQVDYGDQVILNGKPDRITPPANPGEFNYAAYSKNHGILHSIYVGKDDVVYTGYAPPNVIVATSLKVRNYLNETIRANLKEQNSQIASAMLLGLRTDMDRDLRDAYAKAGAVHILAVSGLHVGIIYGIIYLIFLRFTTSRRKRSITIAITICLLWFYALLTGLAPSVQRAVIMFTVLLLGQALNRRPNIYNTLFLAAFIILILNPYEITYLGFQLSFLAVLGIVFFQPKLYRLFVFKHWLPDKIWLITTVSVAAQIATAPVILYYFKTFPVYFWLSNLIVIPAATVILNVGFLALLLNWIPWLIGLLWSVLDFVIGIMNKAMFLNSSLPLSQLKFYEFDLTFLLLSFGIIFAFMILLELRRRQWIPVMAAFWIGILVYASFQYYSTASQEKLIVYDSERLVIDRISGYHIFSAYDQDPGKDFYNYTLQPARMDHSVNEENVQVREFVSFRGGQYTELSDIRILRLNGKIPNARLSGSFDIVLIGEGYKGDLSTVIEQFGYDNHLIIDGSNSFYRSRQLTEEANQLGVDVHAVVLEGAFAEDI